MTTILAATDFSTRSDRALRRAALLARRSGARLVLVHAVDDDQAERKIAAEMAAATTLLAEQARTFREVDGLDCEARVVTGAPFEGVIAAAREAEAGLIVVGPHRRRPLMDTFLGTTAERIIRASPVPVLMANGVPAAAYAHALFATDLSDCSAEAARRLAGLDLCQGAQLSVLYLFDAPEVRLMLRSSISTPKLRAHLAEVGRNAAGELSTFVRDTGLAPTGEVVRHIETLPAHDICSRARAIGADLVVVGTRGRTGLAGLVVGSVAMEVLRIATVDVLAVPPAAAGAQDAAQG